MRIGVLVMGAAIGASRNRVVRAGVRALTHNPQLRAAMVRTTKSGAYNAGVIARHLTGRNIGRK